MSPREEISLLLFVLGIAIVLGLEAHILARAVVSKLRRRSARTVLLARPAIALHILIVAMFGCTLYGYLIEPGWIETNFVTIHTPKLTEASFRIVQISDLHCDRALRNEEKAARIIDRLKPDVIVLTGDYLNDAAGQDLLRIMLRQLRAPLGVYAVTGNHEVSHFSDLDLFVWTSVRRLEQDTVKLTHGADSITISGLGIDRASAGRDLLSGLSPERFNVFLFHQSDLVEDVAGLPVDLYLCGHTHGGQVALPFYGALITLSKFGKKYESGAYRVGDTLLYVNRGLGLEPRPAPQVRFLARPEITVFDIRPEP